MSRWADDSADAALDVLKDQHGETLTFHPVIGDPKEIVVLPDVRGPDPRASDGGRTLGYEINLWIDRDDVEELHVNEDKLEIPAAWRGKPKTDPDELVRIARVDSDRSTSSHWLVGLAVGR